MILLKNKVIIKTGGKCYAQACGVAKALDVVGERWTLLIVRDLVLGPRRFKDLLSGLKGITTNLLAKRLKEMAANGIIEKIILPAPAGVSVYQLTEVGRSLEPVILALANFGQDVELPDNIDLQRDLRWLVLNLKRKYLGLSQFTRINLTVASLNVSFVTKNNELVISDGHIEAADMEISMDVLALLDWINGVQTLVSLQKTKRAKIIEHSVGCKVFSDAFRQALV